MHPVLTHVTDRIISRSKSSRAAYLADIAAMRAEGRKRTTLSCGNLAHGFAACGADDKEKLKGDEALNIAIVTAYNDILSAHQPYAPYPDFIKKEARKYGATAQVAGGVPAMCDGGDAGAGGYGVVALFARCNRHVYRYCAVA